MFSAPNLSRLGSGRDGVLGESLVRHTDEHMHTGNWTGRAESVRAASERIALRSFTDVCIDVLFLKDMDRDDLIETVLTSDDSESERADKTLQKHNRTTDRINQANAHILPLAEAIAHSEKLYKKFVLTWKRYVPLSHEQQSRCIQSDVCKDLAFFDVLERIQLFDEVTDLKTTRLQNLIDQHFVSTNSTLRNISKHKAGVLKVLDTLKRAFDVWFDDMQLVQDAMLESMKLRHLCAKCIGLHDQAQFTALYAWMEDIKKEQTEIRKDVEVMITETLNKRTMPKDVKKRVMPSSFKPHRGAFPNAIRDAKKWRHLWALV